MRRGFLSFLTTFVVCEELVFASPHLRSRNEDSFPFPNVDVPGILDGLGAFGAAVGGAALDSLFNSQPTPSAAPAPNQNPQPQPAGQLFNSDNDQTAADSPATIPGIDATSSRDSGAVFNLPPDIKSPGTNEEPAVEPLPTPPATDECDYIVSGENPDNCGIASDYIIFSKSCEHMNEDQFILTDEAVARNEITTQKLKDIAGSKVRVSTSNRCDVFLWGAWLTPQQKKDVQTFPGVGDITRNIQLKSTRFSADADYFEKAAAKDPATLKSRDTIRRQTPASYDLRFISTPKDLPLSNAYSYYSRGGMGQRIIVIDFGVKSSHSEFQRIINGPSAIEGYIFGLGTDFDNDPSDDDGAATFAATKMVGRVGGVAKNARLLIVKIIPEMISFFDALIKLGNFLDDFVLADIRGYNTMVMNLEWDPDPVTNSHFIPPMLRFFDHYQIVAVVGAGLDLDQENGPIEKWPAGSASDTFPLIVVAAVDLFTGELFPWSRFGPQVTVSAPGIVQCHPDEAAGETEATILGGPEQAAALVAGLVAYFLSLEPDGMSFRSSATLTVPQAMKSFLTTEACIYRGTNAWGSIWNRLGP